MDSKNWEAPKEGYTLAATSYMSMDNNGEGTGTVPQGGIRKPWRIVYWWVTHKTELRSCYARVERFSTLGPAVIYYFYDPDCCVFLNISFFFFFFCSGSFHCNYPVFTTPLYFGCVLRRVGADKFSLSCIYYSVIKHNLQL